VNIPPAVLAQYQAVTAKANQTATTPFTPYSGEFVAPVNSEQGAGIANTNAMAEEAQSYYTSATNQLGNAQAAVDPVNKAAEYGTAASSAPLTGQQINQYLSPYLSTVEGATANVLNQNNQQQQAGQLGDAITSGAFGGDRTGLAAANLEEQQNLANAQIYSGIANTGYQSALNTAQGQQQIGLAGAAQEANIGATAYGEGANTASERASLGTGAQAAGLAGAQAQIGAGTVQQQTQQAQDTAEYQQFLQQESYPFQVDQFLANISEGTGALSGSTTTTTQPGGFFSDERLKEDMEVIGKTFDGQPIYRYKIKGDPREQIGLSAQKVEKKHPEAVGLAGGFKYVDYGRATEEAANRAHFYEGGVVPFPRKRFANGGDSGGLDAVLQAQQQMYAPQGGASQRNIPSTGASHQLAVAQGTPAAPASGSSKVSQTIGLGKDAYSGYKYLTKPTPGAPSGASGATSGPAVGPSAGLSPAGTQPSGAVTFGAGAPPEAASASQVQPLISTLPADADSAGLGAADTAATAGATDAAATGAAADAAGAGAADAAAGAAGSAAVAGATDAAATEAAALAAEYAAADIGVAALVAAKRGGRIGLAAGGAPDVDPYADPQGGLAIPDEEVSNQHLQSPGPLVKRPTGLQTAMKMGDPNQWSGMAGDMFSNEALARGGLAGRRRFGDGGDTTDDDSTPPDTTSSPAPQGGVAPAADSPWWKKSENILPILSGLAAMGTAKTVHPGVALAAGLGAGAESYLNTRRSQAGTEEVKAKATGQEIQNQLSTLGLTQARKALQQQPESLSPDRPAGMVQGQPDDPQELAFRSFAPVPTARPDSVTSLMTGLKFGKMDSAANSVGEQWDQKATRVNQTRALGANQAYQAFADAANASPGQALTKLAKLNSSKATQIAQATSDPTQQDQMARKFAASMGLYAHQYSGRPTGMVNGVMVDQQTNTPVVGSDQLMTGMTPEAKQAAFAEWNSPVTLGNGLPGKKYQEFGFHSAEAALLAQDHASRLTSASPTDAGPVTQPQPVAPTPAVPASRAPVPVNPKPTARPAPNVPIAASTGDKYLDTALADPTWRQAPLPKVVDQTTRDAALKQQDINIANRNALLKDSEAATNAGATAMQYLKAAKSIMDSKGATVGAYGSLLTSASRWMGGGPQSTNYQELAKYLGNAAAQQAQGNFPNATQSEVHMQFNELSPNVGMDDATIKKLLNTNIRSTDYALKSASRVKDYLAQGNEPTNFAKWNQKYYDRDKYVNAPAATNAQGERMYLVNGKWVP
jgi:hypothetical protein